MSQYSDFSSWQPEQERHFVVFEQRTIEASKRAWTVGAVAAIGVFLLIVMIVVAFKPDKNLSEEAAQEGDDSMRSEPATPAPSTAPAPAPTPAPAAVPAAPSGAATGTDPAAGATAGAAPSAPADTTAAGAAPAAGTAATPPPPPKGATKAPPTALVKGKNK